jgi:hypothetical protein
MATDFIRDCKGGTAEWPELLVVLVAGLVTVALVASMIRISMRERMRASRTVSP